MKVHDKVYKLVLGIIVAVFLIVPLAACSGPEKDALQSTISTEVVEEEYTTSSYQKYIEALESANKTKNKLFSTKSDYQQANDTLQGAIDQLCVKPDKEPLKEKCSDAESYDLSQYLSSSCASLKDAIQNAKGVIENADAVEDDVSKAIANIDNGISCLVEKPDKSSLSNLINEANSKQENTYTTKSFQGFKSMISSVSAVMNNQEATEDQVKEAEGKIEDAINDLVVSYQGLFKINLQISMRSNNHVGNEWYKSATLDGSEIHSGDTITAGYDSYKYISVRIVEDDTIPDVGYGSISVSMNAGQSASTNITVTENRGRYSGNSAIWEASCSVSLIERI